MGQSTSLPGSDRRLRPISAALSPLFLMILAANVVADTNLYRCVAPDGKIEFRQTHCAGGAEEEEVQVEDRMTGWEPAKTKVEEETKDSTKSDDRKRKADKKAAARARQEEKCWKKKQLIKDINWKLRRGYKTSTGEKLRHRRRAYEDYIRRFCK